MHMRRSTSPSSMSEGPFGNVIVHQGADRAGIQALRRTLDQLAPGEPIACAIPIAGSATRRLRTLATFRGDRRRIEQALGEGSVDVAALLGVDPDLDAPACVYELDTEASHYADRCLRPRGRLAALRRIVQRIAGCDPALGAVVIIGRKRSS